MNYWLMSLKWGTDGELFIDSCKRKGVIACGWWNINDGSAGDLRKYKSYEDFLSKWRYVNNTTNKQLWDFFCEMNIDDIVYIRGDSHKDKKATIIGKCKITSDYRYDRNLFQSDNDWIGIKDKWDQYREVSWFENFMQIRNEKIHKRNLAIYRMNGEDVFYIKSIDKTFEELCTFDKKRESKSHNEGAVIEELFTRYERNPKNRKSAIDSQGLTCKVCGFNFFDTYGDLGDGFIEVHHIEQLSKIGKKLVDPEKDLIVLCSNCHRMLHRSKDNNLTWQELKEIVTKKAGK